MRWPVDRQKGKNVGLLSPLHANVLAFFLPTMYPAHHPSHHLLCLPACPIPTGCPCGYTIRTICTIPTPQDGEWDLRPAKADEGMQVVTGLQPGTTYEFQLQFENSVGKGEWGKAVNIKTSNAEQQGAERAGEIRELRAENSELKANAEQVVEMAGEIRELKAEIERLHEKPVVVKSPEKKGACTVS